MMMSGWITSAEGVSSAGGTHTPSPFGDSPSGHRSSGAGRGGDKSVDVAVEDAVPLAGFI
jgi:hypothetical protein